MRVERHRLGARTLAPLAGLVLMTGCGLIAAQCQPPRPDQPPGDAPPPCGSVNLFADNFEDDLIARGWNQHGVLQVVEQGGQLEIYPLDDVPGENQGGLYSKASMSLRDTSLVVELVWPASAHDAAFACLQFGPDEQRLVSICQAGERLFATNAAETDPNLAEIDISAEDSRFLQLREAGGLLFFETSRDGASWEQLAQHPTPGFVDYGQIVLTAGTSAEVTGPATVAFDNLNRDLAPATWCPSSQLRDEFDGPLSLAWKVQTDGHNPCSALIVEGQLQLSVEADQRYYCTVASTARYSLGGDSVSICIDEAPTHVPEAFTGMLLWLPGDRSVAFGRLLDDLWMVVKDAQGLEDYTSYTAAAGRACLRVRGAHGGLRFEARATAAQRWEEVGAPEDLGDLGLDEVRVGFTVNHWGPSCCDSPLSLVARFDHYNQE